MIYLLSVRMNNNIIEKINRSALRFLEPLDPQKTYEAIIDEAIKLVGGEEGFILLGQQGELMMVYAKPESLKAVKLRKYGFSYECYIKRKAFLLQPEDYLPIHPEAKEMGIQSSLFIPLFYRNQSMGVLSIMYRRGDIRFTEKDLEVLRLFGSMASLAIRKTQLYSETKEALEARDMFLSMAAHEFRTPITTISGYAQMLQLKLNETQDSESRWAREIYSETARLTRLVNELLEVNRIRTGQNQQYNWQECDLTDLLDKAKMMFDIAHPDHQLEFTNRINASCKVIADPDKLLQVLTNLLDNAAKFSPTDQPVELSLDSSKDAYTIRVLDKGMGISKKDLDKVFEGFYRGSNNQKEGMGLGLYISKQIIERHHGDIKVKSKIGWGTILEIVLPKTRSKYINAQS